MLVGSLLFFVFIKSETDIKIWSFCLPMHSSLFNTIASPQRSSEKCRLFLFYFFVLICFLSDQSSGLLEARGGGLLVFLDLSSSYKAKGRTGKIVESCIVPIWLHPGCFSTLDKIASISILKSSVN